MGLTTHSLKLIQKAIEANPNIKSVCELGAQNLYIGGNEKKPPFANLYYEGKGIKYSCIDLSKDNGAMPLDLSEEQVFVTKYDLVTDFGTSEHVVQMHEYTTTSFHDGHISSIYPKGEPKDIDLGFYNCWKNKHNMLSVGGIMVNENPKSGNWPAHGYSYVTKEFFTEIAKTNGYKIIELSEDAAMGNTKDGWNICCVLQKEKDKKFMSYEVFKRLDYHKS